MYEHYIPDNKISFLIGEDRVEKGEDICCAPVAAVYDTHSFDVTELKMRSDVFYKWTQKNCPMEILQRAQPLPFRSECFKPKFLEKGLYRFVFDYGLAVEYIQPPKEVEHTGGTMVKDKKIVYSNEFTIK